MKIFVVDPSLYTSPYDEHLMEGLLQIGVEPVLFTRPLRKGEQLRLPEKSVRHFFYRLTDHGSFRKLGAAAKGLEHLSDQRRFVRAVQKEKPAIIHFQWSVLPAFDAGLFRHLQRYCPVVLTMHDTTAFNGAQTSKLQTFGFNEIYRAASQVVVHTSSAAETLNGRGLDQDRISIIPHGPLTLKDAPVLPSGPRSDTRWTVVAFGRVRPYKGLNVLIDAIARLPEALRRNMRCIIAGEPMMDVRPLVARIAAENLQDSVELRLKQHSEAEISALMAEADCFVFPYLAIEASGVLHLVSDLGRWMIASDLGAFGEVIIPNVTGELTAPGDVGALTAALARSVETRPRPQSAGRPIMDWPEIGRNTVAMYETLIAARGSAAAGAGVAPSTHTT